MIGLGILPFIFLQSFNSFGIIRLQFQHQLQAQATKEHLRNKPHRLPCFHYYSWETRTFHVLADFGYELRPASVAVDPALHEEARVGASGPPQEG